MHVFIPLVVDSSSERIAVFAECIRNKLKCRLMTLNVKLREICV